MNAYQLQRSAEIFTMIRRVCADIRAHSVDPFVLGKVSTVEAGVSELNNVLSDDLLQNSDGAPPLRVLFCSPVTGKIEAGANIWGGDWFDATPFGTLYDATGAKAYHPGGDINRPGYKDAGAAVYACADGLVIFAGVCSGWKKQLILIKHVLENGATIYTRYAHLEPLYVAKGDRVRRGDKIGLIGDYGDDGPKRDHLHFDVPMFEDIERNPGDWPGMRLDVLKAHYMNPVTLLLQRR